MAAGYKEAAVLDTTCRVAWRVLHCVVCGAIDLACALTPSNSPQGPFHADVEEGGWTDSPVQPCHDQQTPKAAVPSVPFHSTPEKEVRSEYKAS